MGGASGEGFGVLLPVVEGQWRQVSTLRGHMDRLLRLGRPIFGVSIVAFGVLSLIYRTGVKGLEPIPTAWPGQAFLGILSGIVLVVLGACVVIGWQARRAVGFLALTMGIWLAVLHLPLIIGNPTDPNVVTIVAETLALFGATLVLWSGQPTGRLALIGRISFALTLVVFGILHFIYHAFVGSLVPSWIPAGVFWAYFTGTAFIAAGAGIGFRIQARLAALLLGLMFGLWVLVLHIPRAAANLGSQDELTSLFIALAMCGASWLIGNQLSTDRATAGEIAHPAPTKGLRAVLIAVGLGLGAVPAASAQMTAADSAALLATTQQLMDAITHGDSAIWARNLSARWFITDEEGAHLTRADFLPELQGLPAGQSGELKVVNSHWTTGPGVVVHSYDIDEWHDFYGQKLSTRFHSTDTWIREEGTWKLLASQTTALPTAIPGRSVARKILDSYTGTYALTSEIKMRIVASDSGLSMVRGSRPAVRLYDINDRIFIRHGVRGFWLFEPDAAGKVTQVANWRDNNPVVWRRAGSK